MGGTSAQPETLIGLEVFRLHKKVTTRPNQAQFLMNATGGGHTSVFKGAFLTICIRWMDRLIGFVSTLILARLLVPEDFGIIAMASLVIGLAEMLLDFGVNVALIQNRNATLAHYNTAWTLRLIQMAIVALVVFLAAPQAAAYFSDFRIIPVLKVLSLSLLLVGLENIGVITFQKEMRFGLDFRFVFFKRIAGFLVTMLSAWALHSYWGLVIGTLASRFFGMLLSYVMHPMRPRLSLEKFKEIFSISQWMMVRSIGSYLNNNLHKMLIGQQASAAIMGGYTLASEISEMPSSEILGPVNRALYPAFVRAKHDLTELKRLFLLAQGVQCLLGIPAGAGLALTAYEVFIVLLGEKWLFAVPFIQLLALANIAQAITTSGGYVMITLDRVRTGALFVWIQVILFIGAAALILPGADALYIVWLRVFTVFAGLSLSVWMLMHTLRNISLIDIVRTVMRPLIGTGIMALAVISIGEVVDSSPLIVLLLKMVTGLVVYPSTIMLLWRIAGKPAGAESYLLNKVRMALHDQKIK
jgi:lipopolysaccharide exporter